MSLYQMSYEIIIFPFAERIMGRNTAELYSKVLETQWEDIKELKRRQPKSLCHLHTYIHQHSKPYKNTLDSYGVSSNIGMFDNFKRILTHINKDTAKAHSNITTII